MGNQLKISVGQFSDKGRKETQQDFHGVYIPQEPQLSSKGVAIAVADGISSSDVSHIASESAVTGFLENYYCTSNAWSVKTSVERVLVATNSWLYSQTQQGQGRYDKDRGYVCTLSAMVIKSTTAHIFHVGDTRIYQPHDNALEQLTSDHRVWVWVSPSQSYLGRALGIDGQIEIDYRTFQIEQGDTSRAKPHSRDGTIYCAGILSGRKRFIALRHFLARCDHVSNAVGSTALWDKSIKMPNERSANEIDV